MYIVESITTHDLILERPVKPVSLGKLSKRLKVREQVIREVLTSAGYLTYGYTSSTMLTRHEVSIIREAWISGIKDLQKRYQDLFQKDHSIDFEYIINFFSRFVINHEDYSFHKILFSELDAELLTSTFHYLVYVETEKRRSNWPCFLLALVRLRFNRAFNQIRLAIVGLTITHRYHIFPREEDDHFRETTAQLSLSEFRNRLKEGAFNVINLIRSLWTEKQYYLLKV